MVSHVFMADVGHSGQIMSYADSAWSCVGNDIPKFSKDFLELCAKNYCFVLKIFLWSHVPRLVGVFVLLFLLFLTFSALVANPKKLLYTVANPARGLLNREKEKKRKRKEKNHATHPHII